MFKFFDLNSECFAEYDVFCSRIFDYACLRRNRYRRTFEIMEKLYASKAFLKMTDGRMHTLILAPLDPPLAISHRNHQNSLAHFSHLAPLILFFFTKRQSQKGGGGHGTMLSPLNTLLRSKAKKSTFFQMSYKKIKGVRLDSRYEVIFLGPYVAHACYIQYYYLDTNQSVVILLFVPPKML